MKFRLVVTSVAVCLLGLAVLFIPTALSLRTLYHHADLLELQRELALVIQRMPAPTGPGDVPMTGGNRHVHRYGRYDAAGRLIGGDGPAVADPVVRQALAGSFGEGVVGEEVVAALSLQDGSRVVGAVRAAEPAMEGQQRLLGALLKLAGVAAVALAAAAFTGWWLFQRLLRPVDQLRASAARLGDGDFTAVVPPTGIAELDDVGAALNTSNHRLGQLLERERNFSSDASHELRTPVAALRAAFETELLAPRPDPTVILQEGIASLDRLEHTVQSLLRLARDSPSDRVPFAVAGLVEAAHRRWQPASATRRRRLAVSVGQQLPPLHASATAIAHVLDVLIDNALRHGTGTVAVRAVPAGSGVAIQVADEGRIAGDAAATLFQRRRRKDGHGIGLGLARTLTEAEGGRLRLASRDPTIFEVVFPAREGGWARLTADAGAGT